MSDFYSVSKQEPDSDVVSELLISNKLGPSVFKHNSLIQTGKYDLSEQEQKLLAYICTKIKKDDEKLDNCILNIDEFLKMSGTEIGGGSGRNHVKNTVLSLRNKGFYAKRPDGSLTTASWINKADINFAKNSILVRLDEDLTPFLIALKNNFTSYELYWVMKMRSKYSIRIYELLKSELWKKMSLLYKISELREMMKLGKKYKNTGSFILKVIDVAIREINILTDIKVTYKKIKKGNAIDSLRFFVKEKDPIEKEKAVQENEEKAGGQMSIETPSVWPETRYRMVDHDTEADITFDDVPDYDP